MTTSAAEQVKTILEAGTWTNFQAIYSGVTPKITILKRDSKRHKNINEGIGIRDIEFEPSYDFTGEMILGPRDVEMEIYARNDTDRDAIWEDIKAIFKASTYDVTAHNVNFDDHKTNYRVDKIATILM